MTEWSKKQLEEMFGDDVIVQLAFLAGCHKHRLSNDPVIPDGWIVSDEVLRKFAELIVQDVVDILAAYRLRVVFDDGIDYNCQHPITVIQKHFGVDDGKKA